MQLCSVCCSLAKKHAPLWPLHKRARFAKSGSQSVAYCLGISLRTHKQHFANALRDVSLVLEVSQARTRVGMRGAPLRVLAHMLLQFLLG
jgi:hypothetical protein